MRKFRFTGPAIWQRNRVMGACGTAASLLFAGTQTSNAQSAVEAAPRTAEARPVPGTPAAVAGLDERRDGALRVTRTGPFSVTEKSWILRAEHITPRNDFDKQFRAIELTTLEGYRAWTFKGPFEARLGGGVVYAGGETSELFSPDPPRTVNVMGATAGVQLRLDLLRRKSWRLYWDGSAQVLWTAGEQFPPGGTGVNGFLRHGPGVTVKVKDGLALESGYHWAHVSNGAGLVDHNPAYNGRGAYLALRLTK